MQNFNSVKSFGGYNYETLNKNNVCFTYINVFNYDIWMFQVHSRSKQTSDL